MQYAPQELKARLLTALDAENNVVDEKVVLEVISILETFPITREQLESTRLGRHVNALRKKTSNDGLAKRAKNLVRSWRTLIGDNPEAVSSSSSTGVNGERVDTPPMPRHLHALQAQNKSRPSSPASAYSPATSPKVARGNIPSSLVRKSSLSPAPLPGATPSNSSPRLPLGKDAGGPLRKLVTTTGVPGKLASPALARSGSPLVCQVAPSRVSPGLPHAMPSRVTSPCRVPAAPAGKSAPPSRLVSPANSPRLLMGQPRISSPATAPGASGGRPRMASPALGWPRIASPAMPPGAKHSPVPPVPGKNPLMRVGSPAVIPGRAISPRVSQLGRSEAAGGSRQSPKLQPRSPYLAASANPVPFPQVSPPCPPEANEDSNTSWSTSPDSVASEALRVDSDTQLRLTGADGTPLTNNKHIQKSNHSSDSISKSGGKSDSHASNMSRTDVANRKRTRTESPVGQNAKRPRSEMPLSHGDDVVNGGRKGHRSKNGEKAKWVTGFQNAASLEAERPGTPDSCASGSTKEIKKMSLNRAASVCSDASSRLGRTSKVKTTAELIADLQRKSASASVGNDIIEKLNTNQIVKEQDVQNSVLPPGVKPRSRRKKDESEPCSVPSSSIPMSQTKSELVQKFLDSFDPPSSKGQSSAPASPPTPIPSTSGMMPPEPEKDEERQASKFPQPAREKQKVPTLEDITSQLSPLNLDNIDWGSLDYAMPSPSQPKEVEDTDLLKAQPKNHVNGCYDSRGKFHDWTKTYTVSFPDNTRMHVLPYVVLD